MKHGWDLGKIPATVGLPLEYFAKRGITLDCRGPLVIDKASHWGFGVVVLTESHDIASGQVGKVVPYGVTVDAGAWICSMSVLAGCHIGAGAVVAAGSVVRGQIVAPGVMVAGNPARVIARWDGERWVYLETSETGYMRELA
jgi:acetyltransferase-like isoleucine patch superfamily enzyme